MRKSKENTGTLHLVSAPAPSTVSYICENGHFFFVTTKPANIKRPAASGE